MLSLPLLQQRSRLLQVVRSFFLERDYLEVDTPARLPAIIPEAEIVPFRVKNGFLQTSPELCMKLLLAEGASNLFQICHCFRDNESGRLHEPEFTMLEWYHASWTYIDLMEECEEFLVHMALKMKECKGVLGKLALQRRGNSISLQRPWERLTVEAAFRKYSSISVFKALDKGLFDEILVTKIEPHLGWERPVFLYDYPLSQGSLARRKREDPRWTERFELYIGGVELANGFSELVDPKEQRLRFETEIKTIEQKNDIELAIPEKFLSKLGKIEAASGIALGFDRLFMLITDAKSLQEVITLTYDDL